MLLGIPIDYLIALSIWLIGLAAALMLLLVLRRRSRGRRFRLALINAGLSCWMLLAALTGVEMFYAFIYDESDSFDKTNVSHHWFVRHVRRNPQGFRDTKPLLPEPESGRRRVWFAGDSFTFGHGVRNPADRFSDRIGAELEQVHPRKFEVDNIAQCGQSIREVLAELRELFDNGYRADIVVYTICLNDIEGCLDGKGEFQARNDAMYKQLSADPKALLLRNTYFPNLLYYRLQLYRTPMAQDYYTFVRDYYAGKPWTVMQRMLVQMRDLCRENHCELRVMIFPFVHNLGPDYPFEDVHRQISEFCREAEIPVLDLEPVLRVHASENLRVNRFDAHPNPEAHALAADALRQTLLLDLFQPD